MLLEQCRDAVVLSFVYAYAIDPYVVYALSCEGIFEEGLLKFWDHKSITIQTKTIRIDLINDLDFFKAITKAREFQSNGTERIVQNGAIIKEDFVYSISSTSIYNRTKIRLIKQAQMVLLYFKRCDWLVKIYNNIIICRKLFSNKI